MVLVEINDDQWDQKTGGMLRALVRRRSGGIVIAFIGLDAPASDMAPVELSGPIYVLLSDCKVEEKWRNRGVGTLLVSEWLTRMKLVLRTRFVSTSSPRSGAFLRTPSPLVSLSVAHAKSLNCIDFFRATFGRFATAGRLLR